MERESIAKLHAGRIVLAVCLLDLDLHGPFREGNPVSGIDILQLGAIGRYESIARLRCPLDGSEERHGVFSLFSHPDLDWLV